MPLWKSDMWHSDARTPLRFGEFRRPHEILHRKPLLEALFAESQIIRRRAVGGGEPRIESGAHERFVVPEIGDRSDAERRYQLRAPQRAGPLDRTAKPSTWPAPGLSHESAS
jgi:hypothetical protein